MDNNLDISKVEFKEVDAPENTDGLPYATHEGILKIGELEIKVVQLNDGRRIIPEEDFEKALKFLGIN